MDDVIWGSLSCLLCISYIPTGRRFVTMAKVNNMICAAAPGDVFLIIELKKRLARIGIRRPNSQLGPALRLTTGRDNFYINYTTILMADTLSRLH